MRAAVGLRPGFQDALPVVYGCLCLDREEAHSQTFLGLEGALVAKAESKP